MIRELNNYRPEIDGLRAVAVLSVVFFHAGYQTFEGGFIGVDIFFVISGYLITKNILAEIEQGKFSIKEFYERRARRILPALFLVMLTSLPLAWAFLLPTYMKDFSQSLIGVSTFTANFLFWRESSYFDNPAELKPLLNSWSLAVEEQFYILFPLLLVLMSKLKRVISLFVIVVIFCTSLTIAQWLVSSKPDAAFYLLPTRVWEFFIGVLLAIYASTLGEYQHRKVMSEILSLLGLAMILFSVFFYDVNTPIPSLYTLAPTLGSALILFCAKQDTRIGRLLANELLVKVGLISYGVFLWHHPLFVFARHRNGSQISQIEVAAIVGMTFIVAYASWKYVEMPFRTKGRDRLFSQKVFFSSGIVFTLFFITVGFFGLKTNGYEQRFDRIFTGDVGHYSWHDFLETNYYDCESKNVSESSLKWRGNLRCKQSKKGLPEIVLLGDSHAEHLFIGLSENTTKNVAFYVQNGNPFIDDKEFRTIFSELIGNNQAQVIILTMDYFGRLGSQAAGLRENYAKTIEALREVGKSVVLVGDVPRFDQDASSCVYAFGEDLGALCLLRKQEFKLQSSAYEKILNKLAKEYKLTYVTLSDILCNEEFCSMIKNKVILYRDTNHLNILGSQLIGRILAERLGLKE